MKQEKKALYLGSLYHKYKTSYYIFIIFDIFYKFSFSKN